MLRSLLLPNHNIPSGLRVYNVDFRNIDDNTSVGFDKFAFLVEEEWFMDLEDINSSSMEKIQFHFIHVVEWRIYNQTNNSLEMLESSTIERIFIVKFTPTIIDLLTPYLKTSLTTNQNF